MGCYTYLKDTAIIEHPSLGIHAAGPNGAVHQTWFSSMNGTTTDSGLYSIHSIQVT